MTEPQTLEATSHPLGGVAGEFRAAWPQLMGATVGLGCGVGFYTPISSLIFRALEAEFHWSKAAAALSFVALPLTALVLPVTGALLDRLGVRSVALPSALLLAMAFFGFSMMSGSLPVFYLLFLALNIFGSGTGPISYTRVVAADFRRGRGLALATALLGVAAVTVVLPPWVAQVIAHQGWRVAYRGVAVLALAGGVAAALLIGGRRSGSRAGGDPQGMTVGQAVRTPTFWMLGAAFLAISAASIGFTSQLQSIGVEKGLTPTRGALLISLLSVSVVVSRLAVGWALDVWDPRRVAAGVLLAAAGGALTVLAAPPGDWAPLLAGVALIGLSIGAEFDLMSFFCAQRFGLRRFGGVYGLLSGFFYVGVAVGGVGYGALHDRTGSYLTPLGASAALLAFAGALFLALPRPPAVQEA